MKRKVMFYGVLMMVFAGSISFTEMKSTKVADVLAVSSSDNSGEILDRDAAEKREEGYEATEARIEADL